MPHQDAHPHALGTPRLVLRRWHAADRVAFARMNADPRVMEHFPATLTRAESDASADRIEAGFAEHAYGLWAVEVRDSGAFVGFTGLARQSFPAAFTPATEVGWRLAAEVWGRGYATEAAAAALDDGFGRLGLAEVVSMTATTNTRSIAVMERLGMSRDPAEDFDHPRVPRGHRLSRHVLYRLDARAWRRDETAPSWATRIRQVARARPVTGRR